MALIQTVLRGKNNVRWQTSAVFIALEEISEFKHFETVIHCKKHNQ